MEENKQGHDSLTKNSVDANIKKFRVAFEFENQKSPLIIELSFNKENKKILPDNKYFDKMRDNLKSKCEFDVKQAALKRWNEYLENRIEGYHAQISDYPEDSYGDYLILVLFLEMVQYHWAENKLDQKNIWYNVESLQDLSRHFPRPILTVKGEIQKGEIQKIVGGERFNNCADYLKNDLVKIVFIDDFPMEVIPQLFKLQNFCTKPLKVDVTSFNNGQKFFCGDDDNKNRTEKVIRQVEKILNINPDLMEQPNFENNTKKLNFIGQYKPNRHFNVEAADWFLYNLCGFTTDAEEYMGIKRIAYAEFKMDGKFEDFDPDINRKKYAPFLYTQTGLNSIESVPYTAEPSNNLREVNKPESYTVDTIHDPHTEKTISFRSFKDGYLGLNDSEVQEEQKNELSNKIDKQFKGFDPNVNKKKHAKYLDNQISSNNIEVTAPVTEPPSSLSGNTKQETVVMTDPHGREMISLLGKFKNIYPGCHYPLKTSEEREKIMKI